jgi:tetratricopeptide (TPR) repeat protein
MAKKFQNKKNKKKEIRKKKENRLIPVLALVAILVASWWTYKPVLDYGFTNWDDPGYVYDNPLLSIEDGRTAAIFASDAYVMGNYHPVTIWSLAMTYDRAGAEDNIEDTSSGAAYHRANVWLHLGATAACFLFVYLLLGSWVAAAAAGVVMGLHPMHVESVAWIAARKDSLYGMYFFLSLSAYVLYIRKKGPQAITLSLSIAFFLLSMLSKAMAAPLPFILVLIDIWERRSWNMKLVLEKIPYLAIALYLGYVAIGAQESSDAVNYESYTIFQKLVFAGSSFTLYIQKFFLPTELSAFYPYPNLQDEGMPTAYYLRTIITMAILAGAFWYGRKHRILWLGIGFFLLMLLLVLQLLTVGSAVMADRYTYIPFTGLAIILGWLMDKAIREHAYKKYRPLATAILVIGGLAFAFSAQARTKVWKDSPTLFTDVIEKQPGSVVAWNNRGKYYGFRLKDYDRALSDLNIAVQVDPDFANAYVNRGNTLGMLGQLDKAIEDYERAIAIKDDYFDAYLNLGITWSMKREFEKALPYYSRAIELRPDNAQLYFNRAYTHFEMGMMEESLADYNKSLNLDPTNGRTFYYRAMFYVENGDLQAGLKDAQLAKRYGYAEAQQLIDQINARR